MEQEVKDANQSKWYKKMYDTIHKQRPHRGEFVLWLLTLFIVYLFTDEFVTVRYKQRRGTVSLLV